jgi:hypothetical protein
LRWCEDEVRVDRRLWPPCTRVTSLKPTMQERLLGSALSQLHGRIEGCQAQTHAHARTAQQWTPRGSLQESIAWAHPNGTRAGTADPDGAGEEGAAVAQALSATPESLGASISAIVSRAEFRTRIVDAASRRSARCHSKRWQMPWSGEARACGVMRSKPGGRGHHANVARQMTSSALNRKRIAC